MLLCCFCCCCAIELLAIATWIDLTSSSPLASRFPRREVFRGKLFSRRHFAGGENPYFWPLFFFWIFSMDVAFKSSASFPPVATDFFFLFVIAYSRDWNSSKSLLEIKTVCVSFENTSRRRRFHHAFARRTAFYFVSSLSCEPCFLFISNVLFPNYDFPLNSLRNFIIRAYSIVHISFPLHFLFSSEMTT